MIDLRLEVNGTQQIERTLHIAANGLSDFSAPLTDIKNAFVRYQLQEFGSDGSYGGDAWAPLSPKYAAWKAKHYPGTRILERTGDLRKSLTTGLQSAVRPSKLIMWSSVPYGGYHQSGGTHLPARKIIAVPEMEKRDWVRFLQRHVVRGTRA